MLGFLVTTPSFDKLEIEGTHYCVEDDGALVVYLDHQELGRWPHAGWVTVDEVGTRLAESWPPENLDQVLQDVKTILGVTYGNYVHLVGTNEKYTPGFFNEIDSLTAAILASVGISAHIGKSADPRVDVVRQHLAATFGVAVPSAPVRASGYMSDMYCPRCGDILFLSPDQRGELHCRLGQVGLSDEAAEWLTDLCGTTPPTSPNRDSTTRWGGRWFCPCDGMRMDDSPSQLPQCPMCERVLSSRLIDNLIESYPHS